MPAILQGLRRLVRLFEQESIPYMLIGGYALAAYGQVRATMDIDVAIAAKFPKILEIQNKLRKAGFSLPSVAQDEAPMFFVVDPVNAFEVEIWTKPDGVIFDDQLLRRRVTVPLNDFQVFAIGPEDFIVNKLARKDRGTQDEMDIISVLRRQDGRLDYTYLRMRAKRVNVLALLETLLEKSKAV